MPVESCSFEGKPGFRWGNQGKCYTYTAGSESSMENARRSAQKQGLAARLSGYMEKENEVTTQSMGSRIKNPQQGYPQPKKKKKKNVILDDIVKNLDTWFRERWVDISRPKPGGGFEPCGRSDASTGKYPKCVPASRAARMSPEQIRSAVQRKRRAESTQTREDKKPIYVSTEKREISTQERERLASRGAAMPDGSYPIATVQDLRNAIQSFGRAKNPAAVKRHIIRRARALGAIKELPESWTGGEMQKASRNVPTNPSLYARVKAEAKRKFDVYPSAYANAWLVREYKRRGGGYKVVSK